MTLESVQNDSVQAKVLAYVRNHTPCHVAEDEPCITVNFHPDRLTRDGIPILDALAFDGVLKSQFETGTSNGGISAFPGGERWRWEHRAFNGLYDNCLPAERPKYGALNYRNLSTGGSPRFGSAHLVLRSHVRARTTFCYPDSYFNPRLFGVDTLVDELVELARSDARDPLDNYIEAHVHGPIHLETDAEALILDPVFQGTATEAQAHRLPLRIKWHQGFRIDIGTIEANSDYRGDNIVAIAKALSVDGFIDPELLGRAVVNQCFNAQDIKKVWHYLARFGC